MTTTTRTPYPVIALQREVDRITTDIEIVDREIATYQAILPGKRAHRANLIERRSELEAWIERG
jgi:hypothetical protein